MDKNMNILVVDDQEDLRLQVAKMLQQRTADQETFSLIDQIRNRIGKGRDVAPSDARATYKVDTYAQGKDAYEGVKKALAGNQPYAVMFLDMRMPPGWDGLETAQRIRSIDKEIQIVIMTAYADYDQQEIAEKVGEPDKLLYIKKPFHPEEIRQLALALTAKWNLNRREKERLVLTNRLMRENGYLTRQPYESLETTCNSVLNAFVSFLNARSGAFLERLSGRVTILASTAEEEGRELVANLTDQQKNTGRVYTDDASGLAVIPIMFSEFDGLLCLGGKGLEYPYEQLRPFMDILMETARGVLRNAVFMARQSTPDELSIIGPTIGRLANRFDEAVQAIQQIAESLATTPSGAELQQHTQALTHINKRMHDLAEIGSRALDLTTAPVVELVEASLEQCTKTLQKQQIEVTKEIPAELSLTADRQLLVRAFSELIGNAAEALSRDTREHSLEISIRAKDRDGQIEITIRDNAMGVADDLESRLFDPFVSTGGEAHGGLGATLVRQIVRRHHGTVQCSTQAGQGTTFTLTLPATPS